MNGYYNDSNVSEADRRTYADLKGMLVPGTFVAVDGAVLLIARSEVELNAKIVAHTPPLSPQCYVTCVGYEHVWARPINV